MTHGLEHFLDNDAAAGRVMAHARLLLKLGQRFEALAPVALRNAARVANYKSGTVVIHADNGAVATKIRQMGQRLCDQLSLDGTPCSGIEVRVQPRRISRQSAEPARKSLSAKTCGLLRSTSETLPKGPLREALETLLTRALRQE